MGVIRFTSNRRIARGRQVVMINKNGGWSKAAYVYCDSLTQGVGTAGSTATFIAPRMTWDEARDRFTGAEVMVLAGENNTSGVSSTPWFHGWITGEPKRIGPRVNSYSFSAVSAIKILDKLPVGVGSWTWKDFDGAKTLSYRKKGVSARYPRLSAMRYGRRAVLWRPKEVIEDIFDGMPTFWKSAIGLGNIDVLREEPFQKKGLVEWDFTAVSMLEALEALTAAYGDVAFVERFRSGTPRVLLDFFRVNDPRRGVKTVTIPECGSGQLGVQETSGNTEVGDLIDRVILVGAPYRCMLTTWTGDLDPARRLRKGWVSKLVTITTTTWNESTNEQVTEPVTKTNEEWILDDPDYGRRESNLFHPDCEWVFRRYYLPPCLLSRGLKVERDNAVRQLQSTPAEDDPKRISRQAFKTRLTYSTRKTDYEIAEKLCVLGALTSSYGYDCGSDYGEGYGYQTPSGFRLLNLSQADLVGELVNDPVGGDVFAHPLELLQGVEVGADGTVVLSEPAINVIFKGFCGNKEQVVRAEADVALTITIAKEDRLEMDTGQPVYQQGRLSLVGRDGSIYSDFKESAWQYEQITNMGLGPRLETGEYVSFPFYDPSTGLPVYFDYCVYCLEYDPDADDPELVKVADNEQTILTHVLGQQVLRNDYPIMQQFGSRILRLRSHPVRSYDVTLPVATRGYRPGDLARFRGIDDVVDDDYDITDVTVNFDPTGAAFNTVISITNGKPEESARIDY